MAGKTKTLGSFTHGILKPFEVSSSFDPTETNVYQLDNNNNPQYFLLKKEFILRVLGSFFNIIKSYFCGNGFFTISNIVTDL